jgi:hypothetical protein
VPIRLTLISFSVAPHDGEKFGLVAPTSELAGGSQGIPNSDLCKGNAWRALIIDGLNQASVGLC